MSENVKGRLLRWGPVAVAGLAGAALLDAALIEPRQLDVKRVDIPVLGPFSSLAGLRLVHMSDLHVGSRGWSESNIQRAIDACNRQPADLVAVTGDFISSVRAADRAVEMLSRLDPSRPRIAVLGNHDHVYGNIPLMKLLPGLREIGFTVLRNENIALDLPNGRIWFVGVDDGYSMRDELDRAEDGLGPSDYPRILLTHYPDVADRLRPGQYQLSLAGHSHCGQIRVPLLTELVYNSHARTQYGCGLYWVNGNPLHVSSGLGTSSVPLRFRNWPEITTIHMGVASVKECCSHTSQTPASSG
jgi:predicted MPP superfamily phosphohydrolase